ncbi:MAG: AraC family transcriptional regulator [Clostridiales bacterium]|nr:AraC family transcriptional regulator [Clostridiales bacterium]
MLENRGLINMILKQTEINESLPFTWKSLLDSSGFLPVVVGSIKRFFDADWSSATESRHEYFEMVYIKRGKAIFSSTGEKFSIVQKTPISEKSPIVQEISFSEKSSISEKTLISEKISNREKTYADVNDIIIIKPGQAHHVEVLSNTGCEFIVLNFKFENRKQDSDERYSDVSVEDFLNFVRSDDAGAFIKLKVNQKNEIIDLLNRIIAEKENNDIGSDFLSTLLVLELFVHISRALKMEWEQSLKTSTRKVQELVKIAAQYIENNYELDLSTDDVAKYVFLSTSYFIRVFKEVIGYTPGSYIMKQRIKRAIELLEVSDFKAGEIAQMVGFGSQQRFNDIFRKVTGKTPLDYRKSRKR